MLFFAGAIAQFQPKRLRGLLSIPSPRDPECCHTRCPIYPESQASFLGLASNSVSIIDLGSGSASTVDVGIGPGPLQFLFWLHLSSQGRSPLRVNRINCFHCVCIAHHDDSSRVAAAPMRAMNPTEMSQDERVCARHFRLFYRFTRYQTAEFMNLANSLAGEVAEVEKMRARLVHKGRIQSRDKPNFVDCPIREFVNNQLQDFRGVHCL